MSASTNQSSGYLPGKTDLLQIESLVGPIPCIGSDKNLTRTQKTVNNIPFLLKILGRCGQVFFFKLVAVKFIWPVLYCRMMGEFLLNGRLVDVPDSWIGPKLSLEPPKGISLIINNFGYFFKHIVPLFFDTSKNEGAGVFSPFSHSPHLNQDDLGKMI